MPAQPHTPPTNPTPRKHLWAKIAVVGVALTASISVHLLHQSLTQAPLPQPARVYGVNLHTNPPHPVARHITAQGHAINITKTTPPKMTLLRTTTIIWRKSTSKNTYAPAKSHVRFHHSNEKLDRFTLTATQPARAATLTTNPTHTPLGIFEHGTQTTTYQPVVKKPRHIDWIALHQNPDNRQLHINDRGSATDFFQHATDDLNNPQLTDAERSALLQTLSDQPNVSVTPTTIHTWTGLQYQLTNTNNTPEPELIGPAPAFLINPATGHLIINYLLTTAGPDEIVHHQVQPIDHIPNHVPAQFNAADEAGRCMPQPNGNHQQRTCTWT